MFILIDLGVTKIVDDNAILTTHSFFSYVFFGFPLHFIT